MGGGRVGPGSGGSHPTSRYGPAHHVGFGGCGHAHLTVMAKRVGVTRVMVGRTEVR